MAINKSVMTIRTYTFVEFGVSRIRRMLTDVLADSLPTINFDWVIKVTLMRERIFHQFYDNPSLKLRYIRYSFGLLAIFFVTAIFN